MVKGAEPTTFQKAFAKAQYLENLVAAHKEQKALGINAISEVVDLAAMKSKLMKLTKA